MNEAATTAAPALSAGGIAQVFISLAVVLALIFVLAWLARRMQGVRGSSGLMSLRGAVQLGTKERVVMLEACGQVLLLGVGAGGVRTLHVFDTPADELLPSEATAPKAFSAVLKRAAEKAGADQ